MPQKDLFDLKRAVSFESQVKFPFHSDCAMCDNVLAQLHSVCGYKNVVYHLGKLYVVKHNCVT